MMKKSVILIALAAVLAGCNTKPHFDLTANIKGSDSVTFVLQKRGTISFITIDSVVSRNGKFKMHGSVEYPQMVILTSVNPLSRMTFFLENSKIQITGKLDSLNDAKVTGSKTQDDYSNYMTSAKTMSMKFAALNREAQIASQKGDTARVGDMTRQMKAAENDMIRNAKDFVKNNRSSYFSPLLLASLSQSLQPDETESLLNTLDSNVAKIDVIVELKERLKAVKLVAVGQKAPDFTLNDVNGKPVSLYSKLGSKLLLVDFWAGWCRPCRMENPNVVKIYSEFHKKGFDVLGVSLDRSKDEWLKAIADDKLTWTHVSDLQYWNNAAAKLYAVNSIPANFLLDENGVIIARNLRGDDLYKTVKGVLEKVK